MASRVASLVGAAGVGSRPGDEPVAAAGQRPERLRPAGRDTNPILQPWAAEVVKKKGELSLAGVTFPSPANQCWPEPVPFLFKHMAMEMLQLPDQVVMLFNEDHEVRRVRLNEPHPAHLTPSWHGNAVGHYEGDTLVIDTVGIKADATIIYLRDRLEWPEIACAENPLGFHHDKDADVPHADKSDF
jgi:hypothetical protein